MKKDEYKFHTLTPIDSADLGIYESALDFVFSEKNVKNVAVSGAYGAGKSTIVESYKKEKQLEERFLHISLAHFQSVSNGHNSDKADENKQSELTSTVAVLEGKILNQLLHQLELKDIPLTNFRTKSEPSKPHRLLTVGFAMFVAFLGLYTIWFPRWQLLIGSLSEAMENLFAFSTHPNLRFIAGVTFFIGVGYFVYRAIKRQEERPIINKANISGLELEIFKDSNDSFFDKYLSEVLYLFNKVDVDVIVFEDIDRYESSVIFERLHEINRLANIKRKNRPIRFFYLIKDDIFLSKDRAKFFDFIIPVVPVIDGSNSYDQFITHLKDGGIYEKFDERFLSDFSLYIDDMRILKNIYNEFMVYDSRLRERGENLSYDKMLAMIAYKNLFPCDFSELQLNKGFVNALFKKKSDFIELKKKQLKNKQSEAESELNNAKNELLESEAEIEVIRKDEQSKLQKKHPHWQHSHMNQGYKQELEVLNNQFTQRKTALKYKLENKLPELEANVSRRALAVGRASNESLKDLINTKNENEIFSTTTVNDIGVESKYEDVKGSDYFGLLKYLIRNGHINEQYSDYMTYFYPNSLSQVDKEFLLSIANHVYLGYDYVLNSSEKVLARLNILDFEKRETLNLHLMRYMLENIATHKEYVNVLFQQLKQSENYGFLQNVLDFTAEWDVDEHKVFFENFVNELNMTWSEFITQILHAKDFSTISRDRFVLLTLYLGNDETLNAINAKATLTSFISGKSDFLNIMNPKIERLIHRLKFLGVLFLEIDYDASNKLLFEEVYRNSLYALTSENITHMLTLMHNIENDKYNLQHKNYTLISENPVSPLFLYVSKNIDEYFEVILENCENKISDDEEIVISFLNNKNISDEIKKKYINVLTTKIECLSKLNLVTFWELLITRSLVMPTEENVIVFFENWDYKLTKTLIDFINASEHVYNFAIIKDNDKYKAIWTKFFDAVASCNALKDYHYRNLLSSNKWVYTNGFNIDGLDESKVMILIDIGTIPVHKSSLEFLRINYPNAVRCFILKDVSKYIDIIGKDYDELYSQDEILDILSAEIPSEHKISLVDLSDDFSEEKMPVVGKSYSDEVMAHILKKRDTANGIEHLFISYPKEGELTKLELERLVASNANTFFYMSKPVNINLELFRQIALNKNIEQESKQKLFVTILDNLDENNCKEFIPLLGFKADYLSLFEGKRPNILENEINERLLTVFQKKGWITKFESDEKKEGFYRVIGRKIRSRDEFDVTTD